MKAVDIALNQQKLLVVYMFLTSFKDKTTNLHVLHEQYIQYCRDKLNVKYAFGKFYFAGIIQKLGVRRCRTMSASIWKLPEEFNPDDIIELIQSETERLVLEGAGREANFGNIK